VAAGILVARVTDACCACSAGGARSSAVCRAIFEKSGAVFTPRDRGNDGGRLHSDRPAAAIASTHCLQRLFCGKSWHIHTVHSYLPSVGSSSTVPSMAYNPAPTPSGWIVSCVRRSPRRLGTTTVFRRVHCLPPRMRRDFVRLRVNFLEDNK
jgi:hypothetical protein